MDNNPLPFIALAGREYKEPSYSTGLPGATPSTPPGALLRGTVWPSQENQPHAPPQQVPFSNSRPYYRQPPPSYSQSHAQSQRQRRADRVSQGTTCSQTDGARERTLQGRLVCQENNPTAPSELVLADSPLFQLHYHDLPGSRTPRRYFIQARMHRRQATTLQGAIVCEESGCSNGTTELVTGNTNRLQHCLHCYSRHDCHCYESQLEENRRDRRTEVAQETTKEHTSSMLILSSRRYMSELAQRSGGGGRGEGGGGRGIGGGGRRGGGEERGGERGGGRGGGGRGGRGIGGGRRRGGGEERGGGRGGGGGGGRGIGGGRRRGGGEERGGGGGVGGSEGEEEGRVAEEGEVAEEEREQFVPTKFLVGDREYELVQAKITTMHEHLATS